MAFTAQVPDALPVSTSRKVSSEKEGAGSSDAAGFGSRDGGAEDGLFVAATTVKSDSSAQGQDAVHDLPPYRLKIAVALQPFSEVFTLPTR